MDLMTVKINNEVEYDKDKKMLKSDFTSYDISTPASYCLTLLIEKRDNLVSHEELYEYAWRRFGMEVTANTLYQNISELRKALKSCGIQEKLIQTIPRRGFTLLSDQKQASLKNEINNGIVNINPTEKIKKNKLSSTPSDKNMWRKLSYVLLLMIIFNILITLSLFIM
ncbi:DNA-binding winged helix-turn-helix (wHTH) domain-containing protein [Izhakiella capsodis]|uniref:DNA-binding winged helix-turn-helix (WHTH) domain-containing protein n=1 Tax=Izhakiella capsodis TaxID=1367852 RepID=A0A1I5ASJ4_9GAMM|nr:winged helix-turn-helix domain-containing protein [Izhakiella capsodis]SFN65415.1 DNA-binding winged helix-turn-helix (wHTH) domain-containing protein [Izhakiella capsodis]